MSRQSKNTRNRAQAAQVTAMHKAGNRAGKQIDKGTKSQAKRENRKK